MNVSLSAVGFNFEKDQQDLINKKVERIRYAEDLIVDLLIRVKDDKKIMFDYPVPEKRTVLYSNKVDLDLMKLVPINGNEYNAYDDGKVNFSRHYVVKITILKPH